MLIGVFTATALAVLGGSAPRRERIRGSIVADGRRHAELGEALDRAK